MASSDLIVTDNAIDLAIERIDNMSDSDLNNLFERLTHEQPQIMGFVVGFGQGLKEQQAEEDLIYLTMIVWLAAELAKGSAVSSIDEAAIEQIESRINERLDLIMSFSEEDEEEEINSLIGGSSQPAMVGYLADEFFSEEYLNLPEEKVAKMFSCMTVLAEALAE